jgi:RNA polymerase sigma factor (sigma-70 family)
MMSNRTDSETSLTLINRLRQCPTDDLAWDRFVQRYRPKICGWCRERGLQEADAEDVAQNVIAILTRKFATFRYDPSRRFRAWLKTITYRALYDLLESRDRSVGDGPTPMLDTIEARADVERRIDEQFDRELLTLARRRRGRPSA